MIEITPDDLELQRVREKARRDGDNATLAKIWERELDELGSAGPRTVPTEAESDRLARKDFEFRLAAAKQVAELLSGQGFKRIRIDAEFEDDDGWRALRYIVTAYDSEERRYDAVMSGERGSLVLTYDRDCFVRVVSGIAAELVAARRHYLHRMGVLGPAPEVGQG